MRRSYSFVLPVESVGGGFVEFNAKRSSKCGSLSFCASSRAARIRVRLHPANCSWSVRLGSAETAATIRLERVCTTFVPQRHRPMDAEGNGFASGGSASSNSVLAGLWQRRCASVDLAPNKPAPRASAPRESENVTRNGRGSAILRSAPCRPERRGKPKNAAGVNVDRPTRHFVPRSPSPGWADLPITIG